MRLVCPECGEPIATENINVNDMIAACAACDSIFRFDIPTEKSKARKVKRPERLEVRDDDVLEMRYARVFGKEEQGAVFGISFASLMFTLIFLVTLGGFLAGDVPIFVSLIMSLIMLGAYYTLSLLLVNHTNILADDHHFKVHRQPILNPFEDDVKIDIADIIRVYAEETTASHEAGGFNRYHHVWAELMDGTRIGIVKDLPEQYAKYIAQRLEEQTQNSAEDAIDKLQEAMPEEEFSKLIHYEESLAAEDVSTQDG